jgi:pyruvate/2-oxoglutarate/acetoin dehydrogenase E1 component
MGYKDELVRSMEWLAKKNDTVFIGQSVNYSGNAIFNTLKTVSEAKKIEVPVFEDLQMGLSTGMALEGYVPITCYPRFDFLILACNQLVNHLDKIDYMTKGAMKPRVIIRTSIGAKKPLDGGIQHTQDHTEAFRHLLSDIDVVLLNESDEIFSAFKYAYEREDSKSTLIIEWGAFYNDK